MAKTFSEAFAEVAGEAVEATRKEVANVAFSNQDDAVNFALGFFSGKVLLLMKDDGIRGVKTMTELKELMDKIYPRRERRPNGLSSLQNSRPIRPEPKVFRKGG